MNDPRGHRGRRVRRGAATAVGTSIWLTQVCEVNSQTAWMAEMAVVSVVRLNYARAHLAVAG